MFKNIYQKLFKRIIDIALSLISLICFLPIILILFIILVFEYKGSPFFTQERPGKNEKIFRLIKFKSMTDKKDEQGNLLPYHLRITKIGSFIRQASLDEIPQLINVLKGDMSLIGPRPLLIEYLQFYSVTQKLRHNVKPGISGWAQVNGRNTISWKQKFDLDIWYVQNISFKTDLKILFLTIKKVILKKDINLNPKMNMSPFTGDN